MMASARTSFNCVCEVLYVVPRIGVHVEEERPAGCTRICMNRLYRSRAGCHYSRSSLGFALARVAIGGPYPKHAQCKARLVQPARPHGESVPCEQLATHRAQHLGNNVANSGRGCNNLLFLLPSVTSESVPCRCPTFGTARRRFWVGYSTLFYLN
jgi:hypothetical protein